MSRSISHFTDYRPPRRTRRIPLFFAVPARARADGWTPVRQAEFIGELAETRSVTEAARRVGMTRETAYRLRRRKWAESFCAAWDAAMGRKLSIPLSQRAARESHESAPRKVTNEELLWRIETGKWQVILRRGIYRGVRQKGCNSELLQWLARLDRACAGVEEDW